MTTGRLLSFTDNSRNNASSCLLRFALALHLVFAFRKSMYVKTKIPTELPHQHSNPPSVGQLLESIVQQEDERRARPTTQASDPAPGVQTFDAPRLPDVPERRQELGRWCPLWPELHLCLDRRFHRVGREQDYIVAHSGHGSRSHELCRRQVRFCEFAFTHARGC